SSLRGTVIVLQDAGFTDDEVIDWLFAVEDSIGRPPLDALLEGRKSEVRRVARALA
ncbi:MAG TPA: Rv2175c family DNA-binding protein, partial [Microbacterium sp.]|uniref:Rv2175c family DNA-binding protein n=1 Tax=Microbacterium sp. TaxID=51671 RepID=UPI002B466932